MNKVILRICMFIAVMFLSGCVDINYYEAEDDSATDAFVTTWDVNISAGTPTGELHISTKKYQPQDPDKWNYDFDIDWGDGNSDSHVTGDINHSYASPDIYTVKITGIFPQMYFPEERDYNKTLFERHGHDINTSIDDVDGTEVNSTEIYSALQGTSDAPKLMTIEHWGNNKWKSMNNAFIGCKNLMDHADDMPNLSKVKSMRNMFHGDARYNRRIKLQYDGAPLSNTNLPVGQNGLTPFVLQRPINEVELDTIRSLINILPNRIETWNTSNVRDMSGLFEGATLFNRDIDSWDVSGVRIFSKMFQMAQAFNRSLNTWDTSNAVTMANLFLGAKKFNGNISNWDTRNVNNMSGMFQGAEKFNNNISSWDTSEVNTTATMFANAKHFNQPIGGEHLSSISSVDAYGGAIPTKTTPGWDVSGVKNMRAMFAGAHRFNQDLSTWDVSHVEDTSNMFNGARKLAKPFVNNWITMHYTIKDWDISEVNNTSGMFANTEYFNDNISGWNTSQVQYMNGMFQNAEKFNQPIGGWITNEVNNTNAMFWGAEDFNQPIGSWDMVKNHNMAYMFGRAKDFNQPIGGWNTSKVESMKAMFYQAEDFNQPIGSWDTANVKDMGAMFAGAEEFNQPIDSWNISSVKTLNIEDLNVSLEDINATLADRNASYNGERGDIHVDLSHVSSVIAKTTGIGFMFAGAKKFNQDLCGANWDTSHITEMPAVFTNAEKFNGCVDSWDTSGVVSMEAMFLGAKEFNQDLGWNTQNVTNMAFMFAGAKKFNKDLNWDMSRLSDMSSVCPYSDVDNSIADILDTHGSVDIKEFKNHRPCGVLGMFYNAERFNKPLSPIPSTVTDMYRLFNHAKAFNQSLSSWTVNSVRDMAHMFDDAKVFNQDLSGWSLNNLKTSYKMFAGATAFNQNIAGWWFPQLTDMRYMFTGAQAFNQNFSGLTAPSVTSFRGLLSGATSFNQNLASLNVSNIIDMSAMMSGIILSTPNYDALLNGWYGGAHKHGVPLSAGGSQYSCVGADSRDALDNIGLTFGDDGWSISDGGLTAISYESGDINATTDSNGNHFYNGDCMCFGSPW